MAKKSRKPNLPQETLARARRELERQQGTAPASTPVEQDTPAQRSTPAPAPVRPAARTARDKLQVGEVDLAQQYTYVISDLQNMGILAVLMFVVLLGMSFFI